MIETRRLKNVVLFIQTILSFILSRKITQCIINDISRSKLILLLENSALSNYYFEISVKVKNVEIKKLFIDELNFILLDIFTVNQ